MYDIDKSACRSDLDVVFIIDGSGSIRDANPRDGSFDNWNLLLTFLGNVADQLPVSVTGTHVAAVLFSDEGQLLFPLSKFTDNNALRNALLNIDYPGGNTNTSGGLYVTRSQVFQPQNGDRANIPNVAIIVTDGKSTFDSDKTIPYAQQLQRDGVEMISVGITNSVDEDELKAMSSPPQIQHRNYFTSTSFQELEMVLSGLVSTACVVTPPPPQSKFISHLEMISCTNVYKFTTFCPFFPQLTNPHSI